MVVTYYTAMKVMVGLDFRTYHGVRLADIDTFTEQFETYAMQRSLGGNTYASELGFFSPNKWESLGMRRSIWIQVLGLRHSSPRADHRPSTNPRILVSGLVNSQA